VDKSFLLEVDEGKDVEDVYFVAMMSHHLLIEEEYIDNAGKCFKEGVVIRSREPIFFETRCDLSAEFLDTRKKSASDLEINKRLAQAALGSLLRVNPSDRKTKQGWQIKQTIMRSDPRRSIADLMSESENTHDHYN
jgi:hypothetical protein